MNKKKILVLAMTLSMVAILAIGGNIAYFTAEDNAENVFTVGNVEIDLTEPNWEAQGEDEAADAYPGEALAKDPTVTNVGANPCFVRIKVEGLNALKDAGLSAELIKIRNAKYELGAVNANNEAEELTGWTYKIDADQPEGEMLYIYYNGVLGVGETTDLPAFSAIVIPNDTIAEVLEEGVDATDFNVVVTAEAVQAQGAKPSFTAVQNMTVEEIAAWFDTCGL